MLIGCGLDTARKPSFGLPLLRGGCAETLRPRGAEDGGPGWSRFDWSFAIVGGPSGERLLCLCFRSDVGVASVAVTVGIRGGDCIGIGEGLATGIVEAFCSFVGWKGEPSTFSEYVGGETDEKEEDGDTELTEKCTCDVVSDWMLGGLDSSLVLAELLVGRVVLLFGGVYGMYPAVGTGFR